MNSNQGFYGASEKVNSSVRPAICYKTFQCEKTGFYVDSAKEMKKKQEKFETEARQQTVGLVHLTPDSNHAVSDRSRWLDTLPDGRRGRGHGTASSFNHSTLICHPVLVFNAISKTKKNDFDLMLFQNFEVNT